MTDDISRTSFDTLYRTIIDLLASGSYPAGGRVSVKHLAENLHVSPTPVREVLSRLVGRGLLGERRSEGYYMTRLDASGLADLYRFHGACLATALRSFSSISDRQIPVGVAWAMLAEFAQADPSATLRGMQAYLDDRLRIVRRCERQLCEETLDARAWEAAMRNHDIGSLRRSLARFHRTRITLARDIIDLVNAPSPS